MISPFAGKRQWVPQRRSDGLAGPPMTSLGFHVPNRCDEMSNRACPFPTDVPTIAGCEPNQPHDIARQGVSGPASTRIGATSPSRPGIYQYLRASGHEDSSLRNSRCSVVELAVRSLNDANRTFLSVGRPSICQDRCANCWGTVNSSWKAVIDNPVHGPAAATLTSILERFAPPPPSGENRNLRMGHAFGTRICSVSCRRRWERITHARTLSDAFALRITRIGGVSPLAVVCKPLRCDCQNSLPELSFF